MVRIVLIAVSLSNNFLHTPIVFLLEIHGYAAVYSSKDFRVMLGYGGAYLNSGCACQEEFYGIFPCSYSTAADYGRVYFFVDVVNCAEGDRFYGWS